MDANVMNVHQMKSIFDQFSYLFVTFRSIEAPYGHMTALGLRSMFPISVRSQGM